MNEIALHKIHKNIDFYVLHVATRSNTLARLLTGCVPSDSNQLKYHIFAKYSATFCLNPSMVALAVALLLSFRLPTLHMRVILTGMQLN